MKRLIIETENGKIEGLHGWDPRIAVFKGVPYAKPPVGELRFRSPQPLDSWEGIRQAFDYAPVSMQQTPGIDKESFWTKEMHPTGPEYEVSEDSLYLNIFTPARTGEENLPVLFYIHGGGFTGGYPSEIEFDWEHMARKGIVVVSVQYRLGIFGFLAADALSQTFPFEGKGNYGIEDQIAALAWTRRNIRAFGGDPDRITIAGQSAGAMSVQCLLASPLTEGMISGAIVESCIEGGFPDMPVFANPMEESERIGNEFMKRGAYRTLEDLQAVPAETLLAQVDTLLGPGFHFRPTIDGRVLKESPFGAYVNGHHKNVPVIAGYNRGEVRNFRVPGAPEDGEPGMIMATRMFGYIQDSQDRKAYLYEFDGDIPGEDGIGSYHGSEMWFAYDALARCDRPFTGKHYDLARQISSYWANFVKTGDPNGKDTAGFDLPRWEAFTKEEEFLMLFGDAPGKSPLRTDERTKQIIAEKTGVTL
ncbi:MAG: carboxylesterase family protein [Lachnospiraceae bacterium]|nr:carboxylesterase family protein [Lachnospiraceae bacterium]